ncbi:MAG: NADH-quinone oxidoreductase subunit NuoE [Oscillospiraceae bacterium]|jgi:NADH-quinone oxidoreductase subunit E|nr:NADH-quinone oxidoreductase subunit NuoE [Oscillospiraceae bacterium]
MNIELEKLDKLLDKYADAPGSLITVLQNAQEIYGWLSEGTIEHISGRTGIKAAKIYGVATFYTQFRLKPIGKHLIMLCKGTACHVNGADDIAAAASEHLSVADNETTADGLFTLNYVACLGCCSLAPVMMIRSDGGEETYGSLTNAKVRQILDDIRAKEAAAE